MVEDFRTNHTTCSPIWRNAIRRTAALTMLSIIASFPAAAQDRRSNSNSAGASLRMTAVIVPSVILPLPVSSQPYGAITYNVPPRQMPLSVTTQVQPLREDGVLKTMIVVSQ